MIDKGELSRSLSEEKVRDKKKEKEDLAKEVLSKLETVDDVVEFIQILNLSLINFKGIIL